MVYKLSTRMLFCDWHMPNHLPEIKIDYDEYFEQIKRTGAQTLIFMAKTAHGACLFPTEVGITNKTMQGDLFGEIAIRAKALGLRFFAYYNMVLNWEYEPLYPQWRQIGRDGQPLKMFMYPCYCMSNDEFTEHVAANMEEIAEHYPIDGFFLDLQYFSPEGCFCPACKEKFEQRYGYELAPEGFDVGHWLDVYRYQADRREEFIHAAMERCDAARPGLIWSWNGSGSPMSISNTLHSGAHYLSTEAHPPSYLHADHAARHCEGMGLPFTLFMPESQGSWGDWTVTTPVTIKGLSSIALAHGGSLNINHVPYPCGDYGGKVPEVVWDTITDVFEWVADRERFCAERRPVPVVGVLHSADNNRMLKALAQTEEYSHLGSEQFANEHALAQLLMESHIPWEILHDDVDHDRLKQYELLILPYMPHVSGHLANGLREYVRGGGKLLATYHTSLFDSRGGREPNFALNDLFGVDFVADSPYSVSYLDRLDTLFGPQVPEMPLLIKDMASGTLNPRNHVLYCALQDGARALGYITDPVIESDFEAGQFVYHDHAPPAYATDYPGIVMNSFGKGEVIYLPSPFFKAFASKCSPFLKEVFKTLVGGVLGVSAKVAIEGPVSIKHALMQDDEGWLLHLMHVQKETDSMYLDSFHRPGPVGVRVKPGWKVAGVRECLSGDRIAHSTVEGWTVFSLSFVRDHVIIRIERA